MIKDAGEKDNVCCLCVYIHMHI